MDIKKQIDYAQRIIKEELYKGTALSDHLFPRPAAPLHFPDGIRIPYSLYYVSNYGSFRLRQAMLVLFFKHADIDKGDCIVEWNELKAPGANGRFEKLQSFHENGPIRFMPLDQVLPRLLAKNGAAQCIESLEMVLDDSVECIWTPCWRAGVWQPNGEYAVEKIDSRIPTDSPHDPFTVPSGNPSAQVAAQDKLIKRKKTVELNALNCRYEIARFFLQLGYGELDMRDILVQCNLGQAECQTKMVEHLSVITLNQEWGADPSVVLHEFAHALWYLFYVRPPESLDREKVKNELGDGWISGVEEGFADYFAGMILPEKDHGKFRISFEEQYPPNLIDLLTRRKQPKALRTITGTYTRPSHDPNITTHDVGEQWANALWNLRRHLRTQKINQTRIDQLILFSHFKPPAMYNNHNAASKPFEDPFQCYAESLRITAQARELADEFATWPLLAAFRP